jgi:hypothetical protein
MADSIRQVLEHEELHLAQQIAEHNAAIDRIKARREYLLELLNKVDDKIKEMTPISAPFNGTAAAINGTVATITAPAKAVIAATQAHMPALPPLPQLPAPPQLPVPPPLPKPAEAVIDFIQKHPGSTRKEVVQHLLGRIQTTSPKPADLLRTTVGQLISRGRLEEKQKRLSVIIKNKEGERT